MDDTSPPPGAAQKLHLRQRVSWTNLPVHLVSLNPKPYDKALPTSMQCALPQSLTELTRHSTLQGVPP